MKVNWFMILIGLLQVCAALCQFKYGWKMATVYLCYAVPNFIMATLKEMK